MKGMHIGLNGYLHQIYKNSWSNGLGLLTFLLEVQHICPRDVRNLSQKVRDICPNVVLPNIMTSCERAPGMVGSDQKTIVFVISLKLLDQKNLKLPKIFGHKWKLSSTFIRCLQLLSRVRIPKMPKNFKHQEFSECPIVLGRNAKKNQHL